MTARIIYGWVNLKECGELRHGERSPQKLKWYVNNSYVRPGILHGSKGWYLK